MEKTLWMPPSTSGLQSACREASFSAMLASSTCASAIRMLWFMLLGLPRFFFLNVLCSFYKVGL